MSMSLTKEDVKALIEKGVNCTHLEVIGSDSKFSALIVSSEFEGKRLVQRHQLVYKALSQEMKEAVHALTMKTLTPTEFANNG